MAVAEWRRHLSLPRVERRTIVGLTLAAAAALIVLVATRPSPAYPILIAGERLPAGTPLGELSISVRMVENTAGLVVGDSVGELADWTLASPLDTGEPLVASLLRAPERSALPDLLSLEVPARRAVLGRLDPGDLIDVYVALGSSDGAVEVVRAANDVLLVDVLDEVGSIGEPTVGLVVAVNDALAQQLTAASASGELTIVRVGP